MAGKTVQFVDAEGAARSIVPPADANLLDAARLAGVEMDATCGGRGRCRSCRVKVLAGEIPPATLQDTLQLGHDEVHERFRLACQTRVIADCKVQAMRSEEHTSELQSQSNLVCRLLLEKKKKKKKQKNTHTQ